MINTKCESPPLLDLDDFPHPEILTSITDGIIVADRSGKMRFFNPAAESLLGIGPSESDPSQWSSQYGVYLADGVTPCPTEELPLVRALQGETVQPADFVVLNSALREGRLVSARAAPISDHRNAVIGAVVTFHDVTAERSAEQRIQQHAARLEELNAALERLSHTDNLTGLPSRRAFDLTLARHIAQGCDQVADPASLMILDVDHFKHVNDCHGHLAGDKVLKTLADLIEEIVSTSGFAARIGGEEFAVLPEAGSLEVAATQAELLRNRVERTSFTYKDSQIEVTVSVGVAQASPSDKPCDLFHRADVALYTAKSAGRNRVFTADCSCVCTPVTEDHERLKTVMSPEERRTSKRQKITADRRDVVISTLDKKLAAKLNDESSGGVSVFVSADPCIQLGNAVEIHWEKEQRPAVVRNMGIAGHGIWRIGLAWQ